MKDKYGQIMDRLKMTGAMREDVLRNVLDAADHPAAAPPALPSAPSRRSHGWKRGIAAGLCAGAAAAACFLAVPALRAPFMETTSLTSSTADTLTSGPQDAVSMDTAGIPESVPNQSTGPQSTSISASGPVIERPQEFVPPAAQTDSRPAAAGPQNNATRPAAAPPGGAVQTNNVTGDPEPFVSADDIAPAPDPDAGQSDAASGVVPASSVQTNEIVGGGTPPPDDALPAAVSASHATWTHEAAPEPTGLSEETTSGTMPANATAPPETPDVPPEGTTTCTVGSQGEQTESPEPSAGPTPLPSPSPSEDDDDAQAASS